MPAYSSYLHQLPPAGIVSLVYLQGGCFMDQLESFFYAFEFQLRQMKSIDAVGRRQVIEYDETRPWLRFKPTPEIMDRVCAIAAECEWTVVAVYFPTARSSAYAIEVFRPRSTSPARLFVA